MPLLITGSPGSTAEAVLERFRSRPGSLLIVPTATMADHIRHTLVRSGAAVRPKSIQTIAAFLEAWSPLAAAPETLVEMCMERALARVRPPRFRDVAEFPGVIRALSGLFGQVSGKRMPEDVGRLFSEVERDLAARGMGPRHARLEAAAERVQSGELPPHIVFDGFFKLSAAESRLIAALSGRVDLTIALPDWSGAERTREAMLAAGFDEMRVAAPDSAANTTLFTAATAEREVEEVARQILLSGRPFREIGVVLRSRDPYGPLVETTFARFGIPYRSYFVDVLASHPAVQFRCEMIRSAMSGWDQEPFLRALRMPVSGLGATKDGDERDFTLRDKLPGRGGREPLWRDRVEPEEWAARLKATRDWAPALAVEDDADCDRVQAWRSTSLALSGFDDVLDATAAALAGEGRVPLAAFWKYAERALAQEPLRVPDVRRNVVHVLDAYEARQWSLPLVFVCGLTERHFPQYHREDPIVGDAVLRRAGLDTAADREREEQFLFDLATSRATVETVLSYPRFDQDGQQTLPSFFLNGAQGAECDIAVRPAPRQVVTMPVAARVDDERLAEERRKLSASSADDYLQCPFKFFVQKLLRARSRPKAPRDRLDALLQGSILHHALAEWTRRPLLGSAALEAAFDEACATYHVPRTYRTEAVRLELRRYFEAFIETPGLDLGWASRVEEEFEFPLHESLSLRGRVDRLDVSASGQALIVDYKYSLAEKVKDRVKETEAGRLVQAGAYLLAAERHFGVRPAGMLFCHVKKGIAWDGWHTLAELSGTGAARTEAAFGELAQQAEQTILRVHDEIARGQFAVRPADEKKCAWCDCRDICRVETAERAITAVGA